MMFEAKCKTTAMGIMPHTNIEEALELALGLDIPFWPQLPRLSFYHDMYAQTAQNFPGISVDIEHKKISFNTARFQEELWEYSGKIGYAETFTLGQKYSAIYDRFISLDLRGYHSIRGSPPSKRPHSNPHQELTYSGTGFLNWWCHR